MLTGLTIVIGVTIVLGIVITATSRDDGFTAVSGLMFAIFGTTSLFWVAKAVGPYFRVSEGIGWFYRPLATLPEWVGYMGAAITAILWVVSVTLLVDDFAHLPRRRKGGRC